MLHTIIKPGKSDKNKKLKQLRELVLSESKLEQVQLFKLLLNTAQLELITRDIYKSLLTEKENQWKDLKERASRVWSNCPKFSVAPNR
jgi:WASH complex subunit strumpellin